MRSFPLVLLSVLIATKAYAEVCTRPEIEERDARLPAFIPVEEGVSPEEALVHALDCELVAGIEDMQHVQVSLQEAKAQQEQAQASLDRAQEQQHQAEVAVEEIEQQHVEIQVIWTEEEQQAVQTAFEQAKESATEAREQQQIVHEALQRAQERLEQTYDSMEDAAIRTSDFTISVLEALSRGLLPIPRIPTTITSQPDGADIFINDRFVATTSIRALIREEVIATLRLELAGYKSCSFGEGTFSRPTETMRDYAVFQCELAALP